MTGRFQTADDQKKVGVEMSWITKIEKSLYREKDGTDVQLTTNCVSLIF
jgi:hypothetical protein